VLLEGGAVLKLVDRLISSRHFTITRGEGAYTIEDCGSTNGTSVDGCPLARRSRLRDGSLVLAGHHGFVFRLVAGEQLRALDEDRRAPFGPVPTASPALAMLLGKLRKLARSPAEILLQGETGVGKEVHASRVHEASGRTGPFVPIDCAAIPSSPEPQSYPMVLPMIRKSPFTISSKQGTGAAWTGSQAAPDRTKNMPPRRRRRPGQVRVSGRKIIARPLARSPRRRGAPGRRCETPRGD
jgi:pSer/pThr/pTyr-binding forkhead associated (FHA) protein